MNVFKKKFIPLKKYQQIIKNKNKPESRSLMKRTNSQIMLGYNNEINNIDTIQTKSLKNTSSNDALYLEQKNYDIESTKNLKNTSDKNNNSHTIDGESSNVYNKKDIDKYKYNSNNNYEFHQNSKPNKSYNYFNKNSSNKSSKNSDYTSKNIYDNTSNSKSKDQKSNNSNISESVYNYNNINSSNNYNNKKGLIYNYNQMNPLKKHNYNNNRNKRNKIFKSQSYSKYFNFINDKEDPKLNNNTLLSTNDYTKLKSQLFELKNEHDLTLFKLKKEKKKNKKQKEEIEYMINSIRSIDNKEQNNIEEMKELIKNLKEENRTFRQELVLSQALINSLKTELSQKNKKNIKKLKISEDNITIEDIPINNKNNNYIRNKNLDINDLIKEINELNYTLNKKNEILDSLLIENKKLRNGLKNNNNISSNKNMQLNYENYNENNYDDDLLYNESMYLIKKYSKYRNTNIDDFSYLIITENFFNEIEKIKNEIENIKNKNSKNSNEKMINYYMSLIRIITNEFDKLLLYNNQYWKEKYINKYNNKKNNNNYNNNNKRMIYNFDKGKHNLMDLCLLSSFYLKGLPKDLLLEGINLVKNLENLYKDKEGENNEEIKELINRQEKQLDNIKKKLSFNQNNNDTFLGNSNSVGNIKNNLGFTYVTNYYNNEAVN